MLLHRQQVGQYLRGMKLGGQPVPHGHARTAGQRLDYLLRISAVLYAVVHTPQHPGRILDALFLAHLRPGRPQVGHLRPLVVGPHFERAARAGRILFEKEHDVLSLQPPPLAPGLLVRLEPGGKRHQPRNLLRREIEQFQKTASLQIRHLFLF